MPVQILLILALIYSSCSLQTLTVQVDNFTPTNEKFELPYIFNDQYDTKGTGPLIVFLGLDFNDDIYDDTYNLEETFNKTEWVHTVLAQNLSASCLYIGRRYQDVQVFQEKSAENFQYLTVEQMLMDFATVIDHFLYEKENYGWKDKKIILMGGGLGGELALYFKIKYPHLSDVAVVSNAKILRNVEDIDTQAVTVTKMYGLTNNCNNNVRDVFKALDKFKSFSEYWTSLSMYFKLCDTIKSADDIEQLKYKIAEAYIYQSEYNYPYQVGDIPSYVLNQSCHILESYDRTKWNNWHLFQANQQAMLVASNSSGNMKCFNISNESSGSGEFSSEDYLACTELYFPWEMTGAADMFYSVEWQEELYLGYCKDKYSVNVDKTYQTLNFGVNEDYAVILSKMGIKNVLFVNGQLNPNIGYTITHSVDPNIVVKLLEDTPKFWELQSEDERDPVALKEGRQAIMDIINGWL